ncbi:MAG: aminotransferase class III-fold pyridoxal phosphate-dependent enzyme, partial [Chloroflexi bacterium]|nr:aminotransferase class III-fold pyridoxal phosphate-dependent enzyme [Chloroflexota bacterium]
LRPVDDFLGRVLDLCHQNGALLILDEMISGFRYHLQGAQHCFNVKPDLSTFGKGIANGFSVACLIGRRDIMELGGLEHDRERVFVLSTTHGGETSGLAAAMATIDIYRREHVVDHLWRQGERLRRHIMEVIEAEGVSRHFRLVGYPANLVFATTDAAGQPSQAFRTLFMQELIRHGVLAPSFVVSYSHTDEDIDRTVDAVAKALRIYRRALEDGVEGYLVGRSVQPVFRRLNG